MDRHMEFIFWQSKEAVRLGQLYYKIKTGLKVKDPPTIWNTYWNTYCGDNNTLMQPAAKSIKLHISIIKTAKHFQTVANRNFSLVPEFAPGFWRIKRNLIALEKCRK